MLEEEMRNLEKMLHSMTGLKGIFLQESRPLMELQGTNMAMLPSGGNEILALGAGTHPILHHLRDSQAKLCPHGGLRRVSMVLLLKVATMRLSSSDGWDLAYFGTLIYRNGEPYT